MEAIGTPSSGENAKIAWEAYRGAGPASWRGQKGGIEYHNKLIRQYLPKKEDFKGTSPRRTREIQDKINNRPRKKLGYETPKCALQQALR